MGHWYATALYPTATKHHLLGYLGLMLFVAGQERFSSITSAYYRGALGAILIYDTTKHHSFKNIQMWADELKEHADKDISVILVGNKIDLENLREVPTKEGKLYAEKNNMVFVETSALDAINVDKAFSMVLEDIYNKAIMGGRADHPWVAPKLDPNVSKTVKVTGRETRKRDPKPKTTEQTVEDDCSC